MSSDQESASLDQESPSPDHESASPDGSSTLTEDQEAFIKCCEEEFENRFTDKDPEYRKLKEVGIGDPPVIHPWYNKPRRSFNWSDKSRGDGRRYHNQNDGYRRDSYHNYKYRSHHDYRKRPY